MIVVGGGQAVQFPASCPVKAGGGGGEGDGGKGKNTPSQVMLLKLEIINGLGCLPFTQIFWKLVTKDNFGLDRPENF